MIMIICKRHPFFNTCKQLNSRFLEALIVRTEMQPRNIDESKGFSQAARSTCEKENAFSVKSSALERR
jgi:hypothetical protein